MSVVEVIALLIVKVVLISSAPTVMSVPVRID